MSSRVVMLVAVVLIVAVVAMWFATRRQRTWEGTVAAYRVRSRE